MARFQGGPGPDNLLGSPDDDELLGLGGDDTLNGGPGNDTLTGGDGADRFFFAASPGTDTITDFSSGQDIITLDHSRYGNGGTGTLSDAGISFFYGRFDEVISHLPDLLYDPYDFLVAYIRSASSSSASYSGEVILRIDPGRTVSWAGSPDLGVRAAPWQVAGTGDFDHDGTTDVLWRNSSTGQLDEWHMAGGRWARSIDLGSHGGDWQVAGIGDFNGDGASDILFRNTVTGQVDEWVMANGNWSRSVDLGSRSLDWQVVAVGDLDAGSSHASDVLWRNSLTGQIDAWQMLNGNWTRSLDFGNHGMDWQVIGIGKIPPHNTFDNPANVGVVITSEPIILRNSITGQIDEWVVRDGSYRFSIDLGSHGPDWQVAALGDFNGNGATDLLWRNPTTGQMDGWVLKNGQWAGSMSFGPVDPSYQVVGTGDFNGDGAADVLWRDPSTGHTNEWTLVSTAPTHASDYFVV
jgi:hemolysin type calcium-binding protein/VCBS repeat protein